MALKINITLDTHEDFNLLVESIEHYRVFSIDEAQLDDVTPIENAKIIERSRKLQLLKERVTK
jgi:hypothetical protein